MTARPPARLWLPVVIAVLATVPAWLDPAHRFVGRSEGEIRDHVWVAWLVQHRVWVDHAVPLRFPNVGFPRGISLYPLDPLNQAAITALTPVVGLGPALLLLTVALLAMSGIAAGRLAVALGAAERSAAAVAVVTMLGPAVLGSFVDGQTEGMGSCWALFALGTLAGAGHRRSGDGPDRGALARTVGPPLRLGGEVAALIASAPYQAHAWTLAGALLALGLVALGRLPARWLLSLVLILPVGLACGRGMVGAESGRDGQITQRTRAGDWPPRTMVPDAIMPPTQPQVGVTPRPVAAWPRELRLLVPTTGPRRWAGLALPTLGIGAWLGAVASRRRARGRATSRRAEVALVLGLGAAVYAAIAFGSAHDHGLSFPLPFDLWYRYFPLGHLAWKPQQYAVPAWQLAAQLLAFLPSWLTLAGSALVVLEIQLASPVVLPLPALELQPQAWMKAVDGPVLEFPARARSRAGVGRLPEDDLLAQTVHQQPIADAFGRGGNPIQTAVLDALARQAGWGVSPQTPALADALGVAGRAGFRVLVVHAEGMETSERNGVLAALTAVIGPPADADGVWVWHIGGA